MMLLSALIVDFFFVLREYTAKLDLCALRGCTNDSFDNGFDHNTDDITMEEGREGVRMKGLQKPNQWYRGLLMTRRHHPHTCSLYKQWAIWRL